MYLLCCELRSQRKKKQENLSKKNKLAASGARASETAPSITIHLSASSTSCSVVAIPFPAAMHSSTPWRRRYKIRSILLCKWSSCKWRSPVSVQLKSMICNHHILLHVVTYSFIVHCLLTVSFLTACYTISDIS